MQAPHLLLVLALGLAGCATHRQSVRSVWVSAYGFGVFGGGDVDVRDYCASGVAEELSVGASLATLSVSIVTLGVYTPREVKLRCAPKR